jgi:hypothetical protein
MIFVPYNIHICCKPTADWLVIIPLNNDSVTPIGSIVLIYAAFQVLLLIQLFSTLNVAEYPLALSSQDNGVGRPEELLGHPIQMNANPIIPEKCQWMFCVRGKTNTTYNPNIQSKQLPKSLAITPHLKKGGWTRCRGSTSRRWVLNNVLLRTKWISTRCTI